MIAACITSGTPLKLTIGACEEQPAFEEPIAVFGFRKGVADGFAHGSIDGC